MVIATISPKLPHAYLSRTYVYKGGGNNLFQPKVESLIAAVNLIGGEWHVFRSFSRSKIFAYKYPVYYK